MNLRMFTMVYGDKYVDMFHRALTASLCWPRNHAALRGAVWDVYTTSDDLQAVVDVAGELDVDVQPHVFEPSSDSGANLQAMLTHQLELCLNEKAALLVCPPDSMFGDGSIDHVLAIGSAQDNLVVSIPHVRVDADRFMSLVGGTFKPISNGRMVRGAFMTLHRSWVEAEITLRPNNCWWSGTAWRRLGNGLYAVTHRLPTPYLVRPTWDDLAYLKAETKMGAWDHRWPEILVQQERQRVIGSSDCAFVVELTDPAVNHPPVKQHNGAPDAYRGELAHHAHHAVNRNTVAIWREE